MISRNVRALQFISVFCIGAIIGSPLALSRPPEKILSINLCTDEILMHLAEPGRIAALTTYSGDQHSSTIFEQAKNIPKIKGNIEEVLKYDPDLVLAGVFSNRNTVSALRRLRIPMLVLDVAQSFEGIYKNIEMIADAIDAHSRGEELISNMKKRLSKVKLFHQKNKPVALFYQSSGNSPGADTYQDSIFKAVGIENLAAKSGIKGHGHYPLEKVIVERPDVLIFWKKGDQHHASIGKELLSHPAIKKGLPDIKMVTLPTKLLNCGAPSSVEAIELLSQKIHEVYH